MERSRPRLRRENLDSGDHSIRSNSEIFESSFPQMLLIRDEAPSQRDQANCYLPVANCPYEMQRGTFEGSLAVRSISKAPRCAPLRLLGVIASPMPFLPQ